MQQTIHTQNAVEDWQKNPELSVSDHLDNQDTPFFADTEKPVMSYFPSVKNTLPIRDLDLEELISIVRSTKHKEHVASARLFRQQGDTEGFNEIKSRLPAVMISGACTSRKAESLEKGFMHNGRLQVDIDGKENHQFIDWKAEDYSVRTKRLVDLVRELPYTLAAFISPSGDGVKVIVRIPPNVNTHKQALETVRRYFWDFGIVIDRATSDAMRLCFLSHDENAWINPKPTLRFEIAPDLIAGTNQDSSSSDERDEFTVQELAEILSYIPSGPEYKEWIRVIAAVQGECSKDEALQLLKNWSPEREPGEYARELAKPLDRIGIGSLIMMAKEHSYDASRAARERKKRKDAGKFPESKKLVNGEMLAENYDADLMVFETNHSGNADRFEKMFGGNFKFCNEKSEWIVWSGMWQVDKSHIMKRTFREMIKIFRSQAEKVKDSRQRELMTNFTIKSGNNAQLEESISALKSNCGVTISEDDLDRDPMLLGVEGGAIDLTNGQFIPAKPSYLITKRISARYDPLAECPQWMIFLWVVMNGDEEMIRFLQECVGYTLSGRVSLQYAFLLIGSGANGKSVFVSILAKLLGEYSQTLPRHALLETKSDGHTSHLARMRGSRMALGAELDSGMKLSASLLKQLTSEEPISARRMYVNDMQFVPTAKVWITANTSPQLDDISEGVWRRMLRIPFDVKIREDEIDRDLMSKLETELSGILNWAIEGALRWQKQGGIKIPEKVKNATNSYRMDQDIVERFLNEMTVKDPKGSINRSDLADTFETWSQNERGGSYMKKSDFLHKLEEKQYYKKKTKGTYVIVGLRWKPEEDADSTSSYSF